jgi:two-component system sensor histidine kinase PilS (NtrC family)
MKDLIPGENLLRRLRWLMFFRVAVVTFLLGIAAFVQIKGTRSLPDVSIVYLYYIIIITYFLTFIYLLLLRFLTHIQVNIYIQTLMDVALVTVLVFVTGGIESVYSVFYPLVIIYAVLFLERRGGFIIASASGILYGLLLDFEYYGFIHPVHGTGAVYSHSAGFVFSRIFIHFVSFYLVAFLTSFVVASEKKLRRLLAEKEDAFNQLDLLHRSIIESVDAGILTYDLQGEVKSFNRAAEEITGYRAQDVRGGRLETLFPGIPDRLKKEEEDRLRGNGRNRFELILDRGERGKRILGFSASQLSGNSGERIGDILIFQDLTAMRDMEREVERNKRLALIGEMSACFAHEMRNPLASISGSVQMLRRDLRLDEVDVNERLMQIILRGKDQLEALLKDFLLLARPSLDSQEEIDVNEVINDVLESIHCTPDWKEDIGVTADLSVRARVWGSKLEIRQAVWNLAVNALQAMTDGGRLEIGTKDIQQDGKKEVELWIQDEGCGIEEKDLIRVFEPFYTTKEKGSGLGLAIVNRIVESHGGRIEVKSEAGKGTRFTVQLPSCGEGNKS